MTFLALCVLDEIMHGAPASLGLRLALAYLNAAGAQRSSVDTFWRYVDEPDGAGRYQMLNSCFNGIARDAGIERDVDLMTAMAKARGRDVEPKYPKRSIEAWETLRSEDRK